MEKTRHATTGEVALYYWDREEAKGNFAPSGTERLRMPRGKCIEAASWTVVGLGTAELNGLVFLDSEPMRTAGLVKDDGPNFRLLARVADRAVDMGYPASGDRGAQRHRDYLRQLEDGMAQTQFGMLILRKLVHSERFSKPRWQVLHSRRKRANAAILAGAPRRRAFASARGSVPRRGRDPFAVRRKRVEGVRILLSIAVKFTLSSASRLQGRLRTA